MLPRRVQPAVRRGRGLLRRCRRPRAYGGAGEHETADRAVEEPVLPPAETAELSRTLDEFGKPHEFHTFTGAGHAFFSVDRAAYRVEAAVEGWEKIWDFFGRHLAGKG